MGFRAMKADRGSVFTPSVREHAFRITPEKSAQLEWGSQRLPSRTGHHARFSSNPVTVSSGMWPVAVVAADDDTRPTTTHHHTITTTHRLNGFAAILWGQSVRAATLRVQSPKMRPAAKAPKWTHRNSGDGTDMGSGRQGYGFRRMLVAHRCKLEPWFQASREHSGNHSR
jgi:hypothetical protein